MFSSVGLGPLRIGTGDGREAVSKIAARRPEMPYLSQPPHLSGERVVFNDRVFVFKDPARAREAAARLADCNTRNSLWELVDLVEKFEAGPGNNLNEPNFRALG